LFDHQEFMDSLVSRGATAACPSCGGSDWRHGEHLVALRRHGDTQHIRGGGELVAAYFCRNCGFARLHATGAEA
jgi:predicted RNA-binding Zn-ribbon protein involved in translation (DUF1610 family)